MTLVVILIWCSRSGYLVELDRGGQYFRSCAHGSWRWQLLVHKALRLFFNGWAFSPKSKVKSEFCQGRPTNRWRTHLFDSSESRLERVGYWDAAFGWRFNDQSKSPNPTYIKTAMRNAFLKFLLEIACWTSRHDRTKPLPISRGRHEDGEQDQEVREEEREQAIGIVKIKNSKEIGIQLVLSIDNDFRTLFFFSFCFCTLVYLIHEYNEMKRTNNLIHKMSHQV